MTRSISLKELNRVEQQLSDLAQAEQQSFGLKEAINKLLPTIEAARKKRIRWPQITQIINKSLKGEWQASERTIRDYYYELIRLRKGKEPSLRAMEMPVVADEQRPDDVESVTDSSVVVLPIEKTEEAQPRARSKPSAKRSSRFAKSVRKRS